MNKKEMEEQKKRLEEKRYIPILSSVTGEPYLDPSGKAYLFSTEELAGKYVEGHEKTVSGGLQSLSFDKFIWNCFCKGVNGLVLDNDEKNMIQVFRNRKLDYANPDLYRTLLLLMETLDLRYLYELKDRVFIVPAVVQTIKRGGFDLPKLSFGIVKAHGPKSKNYPPYYCAFTDTDMFGAWRDRVDTIYQPLQVDFQELLQICGEKGFVINPGEETALFLTPENIRMIFESDQKSPSAAAK